MACMTLYAGRRQSAAIGYLGSNNLKKIKRRVEIWMSEEQRSSMHRSIVAASEQLLGVMIRAALSHEEQYYILHTAKGQITGGAS